MIDHVETRGKAVAAYKDTSVLMIRMDLYLSKTYK